MLDMGPVPELFGLDTRIILFLWPRDANLTNPTIHVIIQISHNAPFPNRNAHTCAHFCCKMVHCGMWDGCIVEFVQQVYCRGRTWSWLVQAMVCCPFGAKPFPEAICHDVSNHQWLDCKFNILIRLTTKNKAKLLITGPLWGELVTGGPSNARKHGHVMASSRIPTVVLSNKKVTRLGTVKYVFSMTTRIIWNRCNIETTMGRDLLNGM